jgi:hypothetical protein
MGAGGDGPAGAWSEDEEPDLLERRAADEAFSARRTIAPTRRRRLVAMSIPVELAALQSRIEEYGHRGYLLTAGPDGRLHSVGVGVRWEDDLLVTAPGNSTVANTAARPLVALLWPPAEPGGYSLIVDADVVAAVAGGEGGNSVTLRPTKAVLHRPAEDLAPGQSVRPGCTSDCISVFRHVS